MTSVPGESFAGRGWIRSPGWDVFWMFSGLWGCALLLAGWAVQPVMLAAVGVLAAKRLVSVLHAWSTTYMVLFSPLLAEERRRDRRRYVAVPVAIALLSLALGLGVAATQRYPADGRVTADLWILALYVGIFWVGHFWHFGNQDFGVLTLYRARAGQDGAVDRRIDKLFTVVMMFVVQPLVYLSVVTSTAFSEMVQSVLPFSQQWLRAAAPVALVGAGLLSGGLMLREALRPERSLPRLLYMLVILLHPTLLWGAVAAGERTLALLYTFAYLWSHWFIAIGLVQRINTGYYESRGDTAGSALLRHVAVLFAIGGAVVLATEHYQQYMLFNLDGHRYKEVLASITPEQTLLIGLVLGFFLGEQLLHYYCDRCLFRFRNPGVRRAVGPYLLGPNPR